MKPVHMLMAGAVLALGLVTPAPAQEATGTMPDFTGATWYNTPPLTVADFEDHAVLVEVFRTW